jgi:hypothetical protein
MTARPVPKRHWRSYGDHPLPTGEQALDEPLRAFPSWFLRIVCDRCGKEQLISEIYLIHGNMLIRDILERMRHAGCGGRAGRAELSPALRAPAAGRCEGSCCGGKPSRWRSDSRDSGRVSRSYGVRPHRPSVIWPTPRSRRLNAPVPRLRCRWGSLRAARTSRHYWSC